MTVGLFDDADIIHAYTRAQAIDDGVLVPVEDLVPDEPDFAKQAGFNAPVALTSRLANLVIPSEPESESYGQDVKGRLWDVLNMARMYRRDITDDGGDWRFPCIFMVSGRDDHTDRTGRKITRSTTFHLWCSLAPGDNGEPVVTIGFPEER